MDGYYLYPYLEWLHIVNAAVLFGAGIGSAFHLLQTHKTGNVAAIAQAAKNTVNLDKFITLPAAVIQPLTGVMMIVFVGFQWNAPWLLTSYALYLLVGLFWMPVLKNQRKAQVLAEEALKSGKDLPPDYFKAIGTWNRFGMALIFVLFVLFYVMVIKPDFLG